MATASPAFPPRTRFPARAALREATAAAHTRVDASFGGFDLGTICGYRRFLRAQAGAFLPVEAALDRAGASDIVPDWPSRRRGTLLEADLADLDACGEPQPEPDFASAEAIGGAIYVLEGSRHGAAMLVRGVPGELPTRFLRAPAQPGAWRQLLDRLDALLPDGLARAEGIKGALMVFAMFDQAAEAARG